jgi:hypothetical protein
MPPHTVKPDLQDRQLVKLPIEDLPDQRLALPIFAAYLGTQPRGPAGRWLIMSVSSSAVYLLRLGRPLSLMAASKDILRVASSARSLGYHADTNPYRRANLPR